MPPYFFASRQIQCDGLPNNVLEKAQEIIEKIENGVHFSTLQGKRMLFDREMVSIPVNYSYRIIARDTESGLRIKCVVSHEAYNKIIKKR